MKVINNGLKKEKHLQIRGCETKLERNQAAMVLGKEAV